MTKERPFLSKSIPKISLNKHINNSTIKLDNVSLDDKILLINGYIKEGNLDSAFNVLNSVEDKYHNYDKYWQVHALYHHNSLDLDTAIESYKKALALNNNLVDSLFNLAMIYDSQLNYEESSKLYKEALDLRPNNKQLWLKFSTSLFELGKYELSEKAVKNALLLEPIDEPMAYLIMTALNIVKGELSLAKETANKSISYEANNPEAYACLGDIYSYESNFVEAEKYFRKTLELNPKHTQSFKSLTKMNCLSSSDITFVNMLTNFENNNLSDTQKISAGFGISNVFDLEKNYDNAFNYLKISNKLKKDLLSKNDLDKKMINNIDDMIEVFNHSFLQYSNKSNLKYEPIFIVGMPRSGTTLISQIISSHSKVCGCDELTYIHDIVSDFNQSNITTKDITNGALRYVDKISKKNPLDLKITVDKMPQNYLYIGYIKLMFPNSKIINVNRNPIDNFLSIYQTHFVSGHNYSYDFNDIANVYDKYLIILEYWNKLFPNEIYNIYYEDFINDLKKNTNQLLGFCDLSVENSCYEFHNNKSHVQTNSFYQVRQKLYSSSVNKWKNYEKFIKEDFKGYQKYIND